MIRSLLLRALLRTTAPFVLGAAAVAVAKAIKTQLYSLKGKVAIVTGGSRGLGLCVAEELGKKGARVAICGRDLAAVRRAEAQLRAQGVEVFAAACDLGEREEAARFIADVEAAFGRIDVLVNDAGIIQVAPLENLSTDDLERTMRANFWSAANTITAAMPSLQQAPGGARIVNVVSIGGQVAVPHLLGYSASKFALAGYSMGLRNELAGTNVRVTTVYPGLMRTGSIYNAEIGGDREAEMGWFAALSSVPILTMPATTAAKRIVRALRRGDAELELGLPAKLLRLAQAFAPSLVRALMELTNHLLPPTTNDRGFVKGRDVDQPIKGTLLTALSDKAALENNEEPR